MLKMKMKELLETGNERDFLKAKRHWKAMDPLANLHSGLIRTKSKREVVAIENYVMFGLDMVIRLGGKPTKTQFKLAMDKHYYLNSDFVTKSLPDSLFTLEHCANCNKSETAVDGPLLQCSRCKSSQALYCNKDCQTQHWRSVHKNQCKK